MTSGVCNKEVLRMMESEQGGDFESTIVMNRRPRLPRDLSHVKVTGKSFLETSRPLVLLLRRKNCYKIKCIKTFVYLLETKHQEEN
jgi:hypothetical protein